MYFCTPKALYNHVGGAPPAGGGWGSCSAPLDSLAGTQAEGSTHEVGTGSWHSKTGSSQGGGARSRAHSVPWVHRVRSRARSVPWAHRVLSRARSVPGAHRVQSPLLSRSPQSLPQSPLRSGSPQSPEPAPFQEPTEPAPEPAPFREPTESTQETAPLKWWLSAPPWWHPALLAPPWPPALPAPPWHHCLPIPPGPLPLHGPGPPSLTQIRLGPTPHLDIYLFLCVERLGSTP